MENAASLQINKELSPPKKQVRNITKKDYKKRAEFPPYIEEFGEYLLICNYSSTTIESYKIKVRKIVKDFRSVFSISFDTLLDFKNISDEFQIKFESFMLQKIEKRELTPASAHPIMKAYKAFINFLFHREIVPNKYNIPKDLLAKVKRSNLYIEQKDIMDLAESIRKNKNPVMKSRSYALLLLYIETGCRPIEASNLLVSDINFTERTIRLHSVKSGTRKLVLNNYVIKALKQYTVIRETLHPDNDYFFVMNNGERATRRYLTLQISQENIKAFGHLKIHARALRHNYVTNAFENRNAFQDISDTVGHKHWVSTLYYQHRSIDRLLTNTIPFNPIPDFIESMVDEDAN
ncbi:tyrosine-type recombinase/integrase [Bacillus sp. DJP31]|uniref:tyrosine-type recombinase/integrase n=1 Tax=Bacillus sp. DJP31 TaxID=3409789 RepID=UPI003BB4F715